MVPHFFVVTVVLLSAFETVVVFRHSLKIVTGDWVRPHIFPRSESVGGGGGWGDGLHTPI